MTNSLEDDLEQKRLYENETAALCLNFDKLLKNDKSISLNELLQTDISNKKFQDKKCSWYHGRLSRSSVEAKLKTALNQDGIFLLRDSSNSEKDFSLSFLSDGKIEHFKISHVSGCMYRIEDGPILQGLDQLVQHYKKNKDGLPSLLTTPVLCRPLPEHTRQFGYCNILHRAVLAGNTHIVNEIINNDICPDINAKSDKGCTVLFLAAKADMQSIILMLLKHGADTGILSVNGLTPLQVACSLNHIGAVSSLLAEGKANPQDRCPTTGWVALHYAASEGHIDCIKVLLNYGAASEPRDNNNHTPKDVALTSGRHNCVKFLDHYVPPPSQTHKSDWFHHDLTRENSLELFQRHNMVDGLFFVRPKSKAPRNPVLSLTFNKQVFHYEILNQGKRFHIDDGPYFPTLDHFIQHYCRLADGLNCCLTKAITPSGVIHEISLPPVQNLPPTVRNNSPLSSIAAGISKLKGSINVNGRTTPSTQGPPIPNSPRPKPVGFDKTAAKARPKTPDTAENGAAPVETEIVLRLIPKKHIKLGSELGQGEYGSVLQGVWKKDKKTRVAVAIKTLHEEHIQTGKAEFMREAEVMMGFDHACIVKLIGVCEGPPMMLVQELMPMGAMLDLLLDEPDSIDVQKDLYLWAAQVACGMMYLESKRFVHRDLAARNILLTSKEQAKISDFGLSRAVGSESDYYRASKGGRWPVKWYAPESVNYGTFSHASDVWSFGVTLWEMFTFGDQPYGDMNGAQVIAMIEKGSRLAKPDQSPDEVYFTMQKCWSYDSSKRPTFKQLNQHFTEEPIYADIQKLVKGR